MGKSSSITKAAKTSGGTSRMRRAKRALRRIKMKISRWQRNQDNPEKKPLSWGKNQKVRKRPRHNEWNTDGLERHATFLQTIADKGIKIRA